MDTQHPGSPAPHDAPVAPPTAILAATTRITFATAAAHPGERLLAVETAVNVIYGTVPYAVMMMTPAEIGRAHV